MHLGWGSTLPFLRCLQTPGCCCCWFKGHTLRTRGMGHPQRSKRGSSGSQMDRKCPEYDEQGWGVREASHPEGAVESSLLSSWQGIRTVLMVLASGARGFLPAWSESAQQKLLVRVWSRGHSTEVPLQHPTVPPSSGSQWISGLQTRQGKSTAQASWGWFCPVCALGIQ